MSRYRRPSRAARFQAAAAITVLLAAVAMVAWLARTAPSAALDPIAPEVAPDAFGRDFLECDAVLPFGQRIAEGPEVPTTVEPVGRVTSDEVVECPRHFDRFAVSYVGEVVGDVLRRRDGAWTLVNDDRYALGQGPLGSSRVPTGTNSGLAVWLPDDLLEGDLAELTPGRVGIRGDVVRIVGVIHRTDPQDGGGLTVRAVRGEIVAPATELAEPFDPRRAIAGFLALALGVGLMVLERRRRLR